MMSILPYGSVSIFYFALVPPAVGTFRVATCTELPDVLPPPQPDAADAVQIEAWYMDNDTEADQRLPHKCGH